MRIRKLVAVLALTVGTVGCGTPAADDAAPLRGTTDLVDPTPVELVPAPPAAPPPPTVAVPSAPVPLPAAVADLLVLTSPAPPETPPPPPPPPPRVRSVVEQPWTPFATVLGLTLHHPSRRMERIGFHQSSHDGARMLDPLPTAADPVTLTTRNRGTGARTSADMVMDPDVEVRAPVNGTVIRSGTYVLYCKYSDDFVVIEPVDRPGIEVKLIHIDGVKVKAGDRVVAGKTVLAPRPTKLPFESQVDRLRSADPAWPHVHLEVVDTSIPDRPSPGGGCP